jgi:hypothetical protein
MHGHSPKMHGHSAEAVTFDRMESALDKVDFGAPGEEGGGAGKI